MKKDKKDRKPNIWIIVAAGIVGVAVIVALILLLLHKKPVPEAPAVTEVTAETATRETEEENTPETVTEYDPEMTDTYIILPVGTNLPDTIPEEDIIVSDDKKAKNVRYEALVEAAKSQPGYEIEITDIEGNKLVISGFNALDSDTGKVAVNTYYVNGDERVNIKSYIGLTLEQFRELTGSLDPDEVWVYETEIEWIEKGTEKSSEVVRHEHIYKGHTEVEPTCTKDGVYMFVCTECGKSYTEPAKALGHLIRKTVTRTSTCAGEGLIEYVCTRCGYVEKTESIPKKSHNYAEDIVKEATCGREGEILYKCKICGDSYTEAIPALEHDWEPANTYTVACSKCGTEFTSEGTIDGAVLKWHEHVNILHDGDLSVTAIPTVQGGEGEVCARCGLTR